MGGAFKVLGHVNENFFVHVISPCRFGKLRLLGAKKDTKKFPFADSRSVLYIHDGSEEHEDECVFQAFPGENDDFHQKSENVTLTVHVNAVNDQKPELVNNVVLIVWQNSVTEITQKELKYIDNDTLPEDLIYKILPPEGGHLALRNSPEKKIQTFTQDPSLFLFNFRP